MQRKPRTIAEIMIRMSDQELIELLPYIRDENREKISLIELKHILRETVKKHDYSINGTGSIAAAIQ